MTVHPTAMEGSNKTTKRPTNQPTFLHPPKEHKNLQSTELRKKTEFLGSKVPLLPGVPLTGPGATSSLVSVESLVGRNRKRSEILLMKKLEMRETLRDAGDYKEDLISSYACIIYRLYR